MTAVDYDTYYEKHCARYHGWLPAARDYAKRTGKKSIKYLTLCATQAIDVFMFEQAHLLRRDENGKLPNVTVCEKDEGAAMDILDLVRPPLKEAIVVGKLEDLLTFEEIPSSAQEEEDAKAREVRKLQHTRENAGRLRTHFPFDVINFDPYGNLLNPDMENNKLRQAFGRIFEFQRGVPSFLLFATNPAFDIKPEVRAKLREKFESNLTTHSQIREAFQSALGTTTYDLIRDKNKKAAIDFAKSVVAPAARAHGWNHRHHGIYLYRRHGGKVMLNSVVEFTLASGNPDETNYVDDVIRIVDDMPTCYFGTNSQSMGKATSHLDRVVRFREDSRRRYAIAP